MDFFLAWSLTADFWIRDTDNECMLVIYLLIKSRNPRGIVANMQGIQQNLVIPGKSWSNEIMTYYLIIF